MSSFIDLPGKKLSLLCPRFWTSIFRMIFLGMIWRLSRMTIRLFAHTGTLFAGAECPCDTRRSANLWRRKRLPKDLWRLRNLRSSVRCSLKRGFLQRSLIRDSFPHRSLSRSSLFQSSLLRHRSGQHLFSSVLLKILSIMSNRELTTLF